MKSPSAITGPLTLDIAFANSLACRARMLGTTVRSSKASRCVFANVNHGPSPTFARVDNQPRNEVTVTKFATLAVNEFFTVYCFPRRSLVLIPAPLRLRIASRIVRR